MLLLKHLSNLWRIVEMWLKNCEINLIFSWSENCVISNSAARQAATSGITYTKRFAPAVTSTQLNAK